MRVGIILQARMSSSRLPGKVLRPLCGRPMLAWIVERLRLCRKAETVILATSDRPDDNAVAALAEQCGVPAFRGSLDDVLDRFLKCSQTHGLDAIVRATGDNPFVDPQEIDAMIGFFQENRLDYASCFPALGSQLPIGLGAEIISASALEISARDGLAAHHREHVNEYIQENPHLFPQATPPTPPDKSAPTASFTVDTPEQFAQAERLLGQFLAAHPGEMVSTPWLIRHAPC